MTEKFDAIIIGAGQAGPPLAERLTGAGWSVALIERKLYGGTCVNTGCMPTKALVASAYAAQLARRGEDFGIVVPEVAPDGAALKARQRGITNRARLNVENWLSNIAGLTLVEGHARFNSRHEVNVDGRTLTAERIFINVGGRAAIPDLQGLRDVPFLTNSSLLQLDRIPDHLIVVGGGYVGLEFAQIYRRFGSKVTVVHRGPRVLGGEDPEISEAIAGILAAEGIAMRLSSECIRFEARPGGIAVAISCAGGLAVVEGSDLLLATGRVPNTDDLGLEAAGVMTDRRGYIQVGEDLRSSVSGIYALGDCNGRGAFTHTAFNDFEIVSANLLEGASRKVSDRIPGYAVYLDPPLGRVGMTEKQARESGRPLLVGHRPMSRVGRAVEKGETAGLMKVIADAQTKEILGAAILGTNGDEAIHGILDMMNAGVTYPVFRQAVPIHPTVSELIPTLLGEMRSDG